MNVYSSCHISDKYTMWAEIEHIKTSAYNMMWCVVGDFNVVSILVRGREYVKNAIVE